MKKILLNITLILCLIATSIINTNIARADSFSDNTLIYTYYNDNAEFYDNLEGISTFSINDKYIAYTLDNVNIRLVNRTTKQIYNLSSYDLTFSEINDITLTKYYLFVSDVTGLTAYSLSDYSKAELVTNTTHAPLELYKSYSIAEKDNNIVIACINDNDFVAYTYTSDELRLKHTYHNTALSSQTSKMLNVVTSTTKAYIINDSTNSSSSSLWEIDYSINSQFKSSLFPKPNITSLILHNYDNGTASTDYLLAIDNKNNIYVLRTNLQYNENQSDIDLADQTRNGNSTDSRFVINDISVPEDVTEYNGAIYISDSGTKCIQEFKFELTQENKGSIVGTNILVASECGEIGRYNKNSNIDYNNSELVVSDSTNRRVQILTESVVTALDSKTFTSTTTNDLSNLNTAHIVNNKLYFTTYNTTNNQQNIFEYNFETDILRLRPHSIARIYDSARMGNYIYYVSANGLYSLNTLTGTIASMNNIVFSENSRIACINDSIIIANYQSINSYSLQGEHLTSINISEVITDITVDEDIIYLLHSDTNTISKYSISNNDITIASTLDIDSTDSEYYSMTIDTTTGILYLFDNLDCKIVKIINPSFNYKANRGVYQVNNKHVCVYDQPYFLNGIDTPNIIEMLNVNDRVNIYSTTSLNYGNIEYYIIELENNSFGYINKNDLTYLSEVINFEVIHPNASLRAFDDSGIVNIYSEANINSNIVATTEAGTRVLIIDDKTNTDYILVKYYDKDQNIIEGYVISNQVNPDDMTDGQITSLILIGCSIVLLLAIIITVSIVYKKRRRNRLS